jgi:hypothetical protein
MKGAYIVLLWKREGERPLGNMDVDEIILNWVSK